MTVANSLVRPLIGIVCQHVERNHAPYSASPMSYTRAVAQAGGAPLLIPLVADPEVPRAVYAKLDGLLLAGGGDVAASFYACRAPKRLTYVNRVRDAVELDLCRLALRDRLPILAICRGIQVLAVAGGGSLVEDIPSQVPGALPHRPEAGVVVPRDAVAHEVRVSPGSLVARALGLPGAEAATVGVNSFHHQAVRELPPWLTISAVAGDGTIEAVERPPDQGYVLAVQWHPEEMVASSEAMGQFFRHFVAACRR